MKVRSSFVSNSSSASFIVNIKIPRNKIFGFITSNIPSFSFFELKEILKEHKEHFERIENEIIEKEKDRKDEGEYADGRCWGSVIETITAHLEQINKLHEEIQEEQDPAKKEQLELEYLIVACNTRHMPMTPIFPDKDNDCWKFESFVTMYNDLGDIPDVMKDLIVACNFYGVSLKCDIDEDTL